MSNTFKSGPLASARMAHLTREVTSRNTMHSDIIYQHQQLRGGCFFQMMGNPKHRSNILSHEIVLERHLLIRTVLRVRGTRISLFGIRHGKYFRILLARAVLRVRGTWINLLGISHG